MSAVRNEGGRSGRRATQHRNTVTLSNPQPKTGDGRVLGRPGGGAIKRWSRGEVECLVMIGGAVEAGSITGCDVFGRAGG